MNILPATITDIKTSEHLSSLEVSVFGEPFHLLLAEPTDPVRMQGTPVTLVFKETEVILAASAETASANVHTAHITALIPGTVLTEVTLAYHDITIKALVPSAMFCADSFRIGQTISWLVNPSEISLLRETHEH
jgi:hypothetical protein